jgi:hypothetical protein
MKYIILLLLVTACSSTKIKKEQTLKIHYKSPTDRYFQKKLNSKRTQLAYI